jgi:hypothetical protein
MTMQVMIGCDPEMFLKQGDYVSAHGLIPGTKEAPHSVTNGAVQVDGMAVEFNITPAQDEEAFITNINTVMAQLRAMLPEHEVVADPVAQFTREYMSSQPAEALELGCEADYNAYTGEANPRPNGDVAFRTAGGHVHIGWTKDMPIDDPDHVEACQMLARELDFYLGIPSVFWDHDDRRRELYGKPGAYRVKPYGVEYRSLSNAWLRDEDLMRIVYRNTLKAFNNLVEGQCFYRDHPRLASSVMQDSNRALASACLSHFREIRPKTQYNVWLKKMGYEG